MDPCPRCKGTKILQFAHFTRIKWEPEEIEMVKRLEATRPNKRKNPINWDYRWTAQFIYYCNDCGKATQHVAHSEQTCGVWNKKFDAMLEKKEKAYLATLPKGARTMPNPKFYKPLP